MMFQSNSFAAAVALCFSGFASFCGATETVQIDVYHDKNCLAESIIGQLAARAQANVPLAVNLRYVLRPLDESDNRVFFVWSDVHPTIPPNVYELLEQTFGDEVASIGMRTTAFSPNQWDALERDDVIELRTYVATEGNLDHLHKRFRDHTMRLFEKHGMTNLAYFELYSDDDTTVDALVKGLAPLSDQQFDGERNMPASLVGLVYLLAHKSEEAAVDSFERFRADEVWIDAKAASEREAGEQLTVNKGVKSLFLKVLRQ